MLGIGVPSYVGDEGWEDSGIASAGDSDVESRGRVMGAGERDHPEREVIGANGMNGICMSGMGAQALHMKQNTDEV